MSNLIIRHWNREERSLPGINCIAYPDGRVTILNYYSLYNPNDRTRRLFCRPLCDTTAESIETYDADFWTQVDEWTSLDYEGGRIYGGDGTMGNEGFIACVDSADQLIWGMFFENTNPIKSLEIRGRTLVAINEHSELQIEINLDRLTEIKMMILGGN